MDLAELSIEKLSLVCKSLDVITKEANSGELAAFVAYGLSFPNGFLCLVDTYDVLRWLPNLSFLDLMSRQA